MMRSRRWILGGLAVLAAWPALQGMQQSATPTPVSGRIAHAALDEVSGMVQSARNRDWFWVHNDSGDAARIFAIDRLGASIQSRPDAKGIVVPGARNVDWEDIARDGKWLYLCDVGNNGNRRTDLAVYRIPEPDPRRDEQSAPAVRFPIAYPDQTAFPPEGKWPFDCEAVFARRGKLYFLTKHRLNQLLPALSTTLYRLDSPRPDRVNTLTKIQDFPNLGGWVTGASLSPDGRTLAVLTQAPEAAVWLFAARAKDDRFLSDPAARKIPLYGVRQCEAVAFADNRTLLVANEQRDVYRLDVATAVRVRSVQSLSRTIPRRIGRPIQKALAAVR